MPDLNILSDVSLKPYNTFGIDVIAKRFISVQSIEELRTVLDHDYGSGIFILGGGSNLLLTRDIEAFVIHIDLKGIEIVSQTDGKVTIKVAAGENWHDFVLWSLDHGFGGIENLSLIPGNVGTAPIQNIGAYGVELKDVFVECEAIDLNSKTSRFFSKEDCRFGYRDSIFKNEAKGNYIITHVTLRLSTENYDLKTSYGAIRTELERLGVKQPTIKDVSNAVINIRKSKLPDPLKLGNSGSFFKNPLVSTAHFNRLKENFPLIPNYPISDDWIKIPAGWLIEKAGFKGKRFGNYGVHKDQALVLVNYGNADGNEIKALAELIQVTVNRLFDIKLDAEVNII